MSYENKIETYIKDDEVIVFFEYEYLPSFERLNAFYWYVFKGEEPIHTSDIHKKTRNRIEKEIQEWLDDEFLTSGSFYIEDYEDNSDQLYDNYRENKC